MSVWTATAFTSKDVDIRGMEWTAFHCNRHSSKPVFACRNDKNCDVFTGAISACMRFVLLSDQQKEGTKRSLFLYGNSRFSEYLSYSDAADFKKLQ